ncbi:unnamed protein product [Rangifer tarandus platyrhynchus]|uniref:Uncharacterized protein n=2 Tax=Rangifer tarandus platyrhynchus TaxID=3082113 RepID=A0ACB0EP21_RANTA|nr:unnamed protein product [Rangifer tarandus platyrhynchus]CAI9702458.1 unnamed protein product [Rangifer tarandus platyrhynchus]
MLCTGGGKGSGQAARARQHGLRGSPLDTGSRAEHLVAGMTQENDSGAGPVCIPEQSPKRLQMGFCAFLLELQTDLLRKLPSAYRQRLSLTLSRSPGGPERRERTTAVRNKPRFERCHKGGPCTISGFSSTPCSPACLPSFLPSRRAEAPSGSTLGAAGHSAASSSRAGRRGCRREADGRWACARRALKTRLSGRKQKDPRPLVHGTPARPRLAVFLQLAEFHLSSSVSPLGELTGRRAILLQPVLATEIHMPIC